MGLLAVIAAGLPRPVWRGGRIDAALGAVPLRVHVNGTRGKSSVTKAIAALFRELGKKAVGKTTGTLPVVIEPDGTERRIGRRGRTACRSRCGFCAMRPPPEPTQRCWNAWPWTRCFNGCASTFSSGRTSGSLPMYAGITSRRWAVTSRKSPAPWPTPFPATACWLPPMPASRRCLRKWPRSGARKWSWWARTRWPGPSGSLRARRRARHEPAGAEPPGEGGWNGQVGQVVARLEDELLKMHAENVAVACKVVELAGFPEAAVWDVAGSCPGRGCT